MKKFAKCMAAACAAAAVAFVPLFAGCTSATYGRDGQDVSIYEIYEATNAARVEEGLPELSFLDFIEEYLGYTGSEVEEITSLKAAINRSLLSSVSILSTFRAQGDPPSLAYEDETYAGAGVIIDVDKDAGDMYVVTNAHVVYFSDGRGDGFCDDIELYLYGSEYSVTYENGQAYMTGGNPISAQIIGASLTYDIAVLKVEGSDAVKNSLAVAATWTSEENISVGETVYAIGNPEGECLSATTGVVSRESEEISIDMYDTTYDTSDDFTYRVMRTDAAINGGNSGGGLFNSSGEVVGIVNAKSSGSAVDNMGYAIPAAVARRVAQNMIAAYEETGQEAHYISRAVLGITVQASDSTAVVDNDTNLVSVEELITVRSLNPDSVARGTLEEGDMLTDISLTSADGKVKEDVEITRLYTVTDVLLAAVSGDSVTLTVNRAGEDEPLTFTYALTSSNFTITTD